MLKMARSQLGTGFNLFLVLIAFGSAAVHNVKQYDGTKLSSRPIQHNTIGLLEDITDLKYQMSTKYIKDKLLLPRKPWLVGAVSSSNYVDKSRYDSIGQERVHSHSTKENYPRVPTNSKHVAYSARQVFTRSVITNSEQYKGANLDVEDEDNCTHPQEPMPKYNNSCEFVHAECTDKAELIDYLAFVCCNLTTTQPLGMIMMAIWLLYLISLLATTVDNHFVPPLNFLAEKLKLSPSVAGVTLLALGNGAPDIFVVYSGLVQDDLALVLGALAGAGIFITSVVLGSVIFLTKVSPLRVDGIDFMRDVIAFIIVAATVIGVAFDGRVFLIEACMFPLIYVVYIGCVIAVSYIREWWGKKNQAMYGKVEEQVYCSEDHTKSISLEHSLPLKSPSVDKQNESLPLTKLCDEEKTSKYIQLNGLTLPRKVNILLKILWFIQWPFSLLRWMTIPPFSHDGSWSWLHYVLAAFSPVPMSMILLLTAKGWNGFEMDIGEMPMPVVLLLLALCISALLFFLLGPKGKPHWALRMLLVPLAFIMAIIWLNLEANEIVSVLRAFGILLSIDTAILGLTILAIGNCVADWVADVVVARAGKPEMAVASCFGSPLMSHVLGLSVAMIVKIAFYNHGQPYRFHIHSFSYTEVKLSWIFLGISLIGNAIAFPLFRFSPPRWYGIPLMSVYVVFIVFAVLGETNVLPVKL